MDQVGQRCIIHNLAPPEMLIGLICAHAITQTQMENQFIDQNKLELSTLVCEIKLLQASGLCTSCNWFQMQPLTALQGWRLLSYLITFPAEVTWLQHSKCLFCMLRKGLKLIQDLLVLPCSHGHGEFKHFALEGRGLGLKSQLNLHMSVPVMAVSIEDQTAIEDSLSAEFRMHQTCVT